LNVSTTCPKQLKKIKSIVDLNTDIIFLSDLRLNNSDSVRDIESAFLNATSNKYRLYYNSTKNKRGTGILLKDSLNTSNLNIFKDETENILGINLTIDGHSLNLASIYGPNNDDPIFFRDLSRFLQLYPDSPSIVGGDWNATLSTDNSPDKIDTFGMASPPSIFRSHCISEICDTHSLTDPFRVLYPDLRDFTYRPRSRNANRSRLDYFLISDALINNIKCCKINPSLTTELFDHKAVKLYINKIESVPKKFIDNTVLNHPRLQFVIQAAVIDCYLNHAVPAPGLDIERGLQEVGLFFGLLRDINDIELELELNGNDNLLELRKQGLITELTDRSGTLPDPETLNNLALSCDDDVFFEVLVGNIKNSILSLQAWYKKFSSIKKIQSSPELMP